MPPEDEDFSDVVRESPSEGRGEAGLADIARVGQEKPQDLKDKEDNHNELRKLGKTASSKDLPQVDWAYTEEGTLVIQFQDKVLLKQVPTDDPTMARDFAAASHTDTPVREPTFKREGQEDPNAKPPSVGEFLKKQYEEAPQVAGRIADDYARAWSNPGAVIDESVRRAEETISDIGKGDGAERGLSDFSNSLSRRTFETRPDGATEYTVKAGDTLTRIAEDSLKNQHKDDPNYKPTPEEVKREIDAIARANEIENPNLIHTGDKLV